MKANPMRAALERGELQIGTWINMVRTPAILPLLKAAGLDFARVDMEHSPPSIETIADMALLARAIDFPIAVRPPKANREWITRLLDAGVWNIHCPQVETTEQAAEIVQASHYSPMGSRGMAGLGPGSDFEKGASLVKRRAFANEQVFITVMLETAGSFEHLEAIAAMPGIHALTLGPADLAQDLGVFGTPDQVRLLNEKRDLVLDACRRFNKVCSMLVTSAEEARRWRELGALLLVYSTDVDVIYDGFNVVAKQLRGV